MSGNSINFDDKKNFKNRLIQKQKTFDIKILMLIKYLSLKTKNMVNIIRLNTLLGIMVMMLLNHYI